jgi:glutathione S-transferase
MMKLHYSPFSPFARMVRVIAHELGIADQIELVLAEGLGPVVPHETLIRDNPLGKIPALVTDHGTAIYDSRVIVEYLLHHAGDEKLLPGEPVPRFRVLTLQALAQGMADAAVQYRYETFARPEQLRWPDYAARQKERILAAVAAASGYETLSVGSISLACSLFYLDARMREIDWRTGNAELTRWHEAFIARPSMVATKP